eukprot:SAG31_NODE_3278_length_4472_cov_1.683512_2_plen_160_part_00
MHAPSGCVYNSALDADQEALDDYIESKRALWRYEPPTPEGPPGEGDLCGAGETPPRGAYNVDYVPETMDPVDRCTCDPCYITMSDHTNRMSTGGYIEYCNLHVCGADGTRWEPSGGFAVVDEDASKSEIPPHYKTLREIADTLGVSPEVCMTVSLDRYK